MGRGAGRVTLGDAAARMDRVPPGSIDAVFFDLGGTLLDETRSWGWWADQVGVQHLAFFAVLGAVIERGEHHHRAFQIVRPGFDIVEERRRIVETGRRSPDDFDASDFYPDALGCLQTLRAQGYLLGIAGNQPARAAELLAELGMPVDAIATSAGWGVEKPSPRFFERIVEESGVRRERIAYVGDRLDNDVLPAAAAGLYAVFLRRGPWGFIHAERPEASAAHLQLDSLKVLPAALARA